MTALVKTPDLAKTPDPGRLLLLKLTLNEKLELLKAVGAQIIELIPEEVLEEIQQLAPSLEEKTNDGFDYVDFKRIHTFHLFLCHRGLEAHHDQGLEVEAERELQQLRSLCMCCNNNSLIKSVFLTLWQNTHSLCHTDS